AEEPKQVEPVAAPVAEEPKPEEAVAALTEEPKQEETVAAPIAEETKQEESKQEESAPKAEELVETKAEDKLAAEEPKQDTAADAKAEDKPADEPKQEALPEAAEEPVSEAKNEDEPAEVKPAAENTPAETQSAPSNETAAPSVAQSDNQAASEASDAKQPRTSTSESVERKKHRGIMGFFKQLFVMSRCPDAIKVERVFDGVVPQVYSIMDLQMNFIGQLDPHSSYGVKCKHGDDECRGNIDQLCALAHNKDLAMFWQFLSCLNKNPWTIGRGEAALKCASLAGLDSSFYTCVSSGEGRQLLEQSVENSQFIGVNTSATVFIDGKPRCVEDAGWRDCPGGHNPSDFIRDICAAYKGSRPSICSGYPPSV
ncbi:hypothetical protein EV183_004441, partial [Coemansia sp. RSA 2336]